MSTPRWTLDEHLRIDAEIHATLLAVRPGDWRGRRAAYRKAYELASPATAEHYDPYIIDVCMTPIERGVWWDIRVLGLPFYPQFPVGRFFVDFGDPVQKIAIECDGAAYHDCSKDKERDAELARLGWDVIRIPGWRCIRSDDDTEGSTSIIRRLAYDRY